MDSVIRSLNPLKASIEHPFHLEGDIWLVPCKKNPILNEYTPLFNPIDPAAFLQNSSDKHVWTKEEDAILRSLTELHGIKHWKPISQRLNHIFHKGYPIRSARNCRERWFNYADPELNKGSWTIEEDHQLITLQATIGKRWSMISKRMPGRNAHSVKNRWIHLNRKREDEERKTRQSFSTIDSETEGGEVIEENGDEKSIDIALEAISTVPKTIPLAQIEEPFYIKENEERDDSDMDFSPTSLFLSLQ